MQSKAYPRPKMSMNGIPVYRSESIIFIPLPPDKWRVIPGGCACRMCQQHPERGSYWDTLAVSVRPEPHRKQETTWVVHAPEYHFED